MQNAILPAASTISGILKRKGFIEKAESEKHKPFIRFEREQANELWQMDFKGHFEMFDNKRCHPLTIVDDHSRFNLSLRACLNETTNTTRNHLIDIFRHYGLPLQINVDNGPPWGAHNAHRYTTLSVWLIRLGITVSFSKIYHPETNGKVERFHRTLKTEVLKYRTMKNIKHAQCVFDEWRDCYNFERPHESLDMQVPGERYCISPKIFPKKLEPIEYGPEDIVRRVQASGTFHFKSKKFRISKAFRGQPIALRHTTKEGAYHVYYCHQKVSSIDINNCLD